MNPGKVMRATIRCMILLALLPSLAMFVAMVYIGWGAVIDREPPLRNLQATLVEYDPEDRVALIEWSGIRTRFCPGRTTRQLRDTFIIDLDGGQITTAGTVDDRRWQGQYPGARDYEVKWLTEIPIPSDLRGIVRYSATFYYSCNVAQQMFPLVVSPPEVHINVGDPRTLGTFDGG